MRRKITGDLLNIKIYILISILLGIFLLNVSYSQQPVNIPSIAVPGYDQPTVRQPNVRQQRILQQGYPQSTIRQPSIPQSTIRQPTVPQPPAYPYGSRQPSRGQQPPPSIGEGQVTSPSVDRQRRVPSTTGGRGDVPLTEEESLQRDQSSVERMFNSRFKGESYEYLTQFGYNFFQREISIEYLPVGETYRVGPGDNIAIYFWGDPVDVLGLNGFYSLTIDRDGKIYIPNLGVFYIWGLNLTKVKKNIYKAMSRKFKKFEIEVTLGRLREFQVYVTGYVRQPGMITCTALHNVLDVLTLAGGIEKNGSLRDIIIHRKVKGKLKKMKIDLYDFLIKGELVDIRIREGDSILVKSIGNTVGISGVVHRPAVYELGENNTVNDLLNFAGGILPSAYSFSVKLIRYEQNNLNIYGGDLKEREFKKKKLVNGDYIRIDSLSDIIKNEINVKGHVAYKGKYSFK